MSRGRAIAWLAIACAGACVGADDPGGAWERAERIVGELAPDLGPLPALRANPGCTVRVATFNVHYAHDPEASRRTSARRRTCLPPTSS